VDELLVHEVPVPQLFDPVVHILLDVVGLQPPLPVIRLFLIEDQVDGLVVLPINVEELESVLLEGLEILLGLLVGGGTQAFVVLDFPAL
jgi:hypothetical protein